MGPSLPGCISRIVSVQFPFHLGPLLERQPGAFDRLVADLGGKRWATPPLIVNVKPKDIRVYVGRSHDENLHQPPPERPLAVIPEVLPTRHAATVALPTWTLLLGDDNVVPMVRAPGRREVVVALRQTWLPTRGSLEEPPLEKRVAELLAHAAKPHDGSAMTKLSCGTPTPSAPGFVRCLSFTA